MKAELGEALPYARAAPVPTRVAYLTNAYPKVSHSFIRREILALERRGIEVLRFTIRASAEPLPDREDRRERERTTILLSDWPSLLSAPFRVAAGHPRRFFRALRSALTTAESGATGVVRRIAYLAEACRLVLLLKAAGVRHVHVHFGTNPAAVARLAGILGDISYSLTVHGPDEFDAPVPLALGRKVADAAFAVAVSTYGRGQLMRWSRITDWPKLHVVRCGIDRSFLDSGMTGIGRRSRTLLCVARLSAQKGLPLLLNAAAQLAADGSEFELHIVGDGELRTQIEARIVELGLRDHVRILGWRNSEEVRGLLSSCRAFVLPSFAEGLPVVLMEALALGRPVVATAIAGIPELVDSGCGWLVPSGCAEALAGAMRSALQADPDMLRSMGAIGRDRVAARHDVDLNAAALADLLRPLARAPA